MMIADIIHLNIRLSIVWVSVLVLASVVLFVFVRLVVPGFANSGLRNFQSAAEPWSLLC